MEAAADSRSPDLLLCLATETKAPTAGDNGTVASIGSNGVSCTRGGGDDKASFTSKAELDEGGEGNEGSGVSNGVDANGADSKGADSKGTGTGSGIGSGLTSENSLSGCVLTICLGEAPCGFGLFCGPEELGRKTGC